VADRQRQRRRLRPPGDRPRRPVGPPRDGRARGQARAGAGGCDGQGPPGRSGAGLGRGGDQGRPDVADRLAAEGRRGRRARPAAGGDLLPDRAAELGQGRGDRGAGLRHGARLDAGRCHDVRPADERVGPQPGDPEPALLPADQQGQRPAAHPRGDPRGHPGPHLAGGADLAAGGHRRLHGLPRAAAVRGHPARDLARTGRRRVGRAATSRPTTWRGSLPAPSSRTGTARPPCAAGTTSWPRRRGRSRPTRRPRR
jgi:hypothetical protein